MNSPYEQVSFHPKSTVTSLLTVIHNLLRI